MAFGPRGTPHCFQNVGDELGRLLVITTPAGVERYFEEFAELPPGPVDPQVHAALARATGIELVGPPLEVSDPSTPEDRPPVGDFEEFHRDFLPRFIEAQRAFHDGDAEPNIALWTTKDPVTLLAARGRCDRVTEHVTQTFRWVASEFSDVRHHEWELLASGVSGDLAYTVAIERCWLSIRGGPQALTEPRATHVFRREAGHWQTVHRHADIKVCHRRRDTDVRTGDKQEAGMKIRGGAAAILAAAAIALSTGPSTAVGPPEAVSIAIHAERGCPAPDSCTFSASGAINDQSIVVTESIKAFALPSPVVGTAQYVRTFIGAEGSITTRLESRIRPTDDPAVWHEEGRWVVVSATGMYAELDGWGDETGTRNFGTQSLDTTYAGYLHRGPAYADSDALT